MYIDLNVPYDPANISQVKQAIAALVKRTCPPTVALFLLTLFQLVLGVLLSTILFLGDWLQLMFVNEVVM